MNISDLQTGDILLVSDKEPGIFNWFLDIIKYGTHSNYVHIGMIVKNPSFNEDLNGTYLWESSYEGTPDPQDNKIKLGVQLTEISKLQENYPNATFFVRRLKNNQYFTDEKLKQIHNNVYDIPYDTNIFDWIMAFFRKDIDPQKTSRFWCSALVGYIYTECSILDSATDWSILYPSDFALDGESLNFNDDNSFLPIEMLLILSENEKKINLSDYIENLDTLDEETEL